MSFLGSADSGIAENVTMSPEQRVLQEVLDTENVYVTDLKQVVEVSPLMEQVQSLLDALLDAVFFSVYTYMVM